MSDYEEYEKQRGNPFYQPHIDDQFDDEVEDIPDPEDWIIP
jgi:hypothetical protein